MQSGAELLVRGSSRGDVDDRLLFAVSAYAMFVGLEDALWLVLVRAGRLVGVGWSIAAAAVAAAASAASASAVALALAAALCAALGICRRCGRVGEESRLVVVRRR